MTRYVTCTACGRVTSMNPGDKYPVKCYGGVAKHPYIPRPATKVEATRCALLDERWAIRNGFGFCYTAEAKAKARARLDAIEAELAESDVEVGILPAITAQ